jgi:hypothetical protein
MREWSLCSQRAYHHERARCLGISLTGETFRRYTFYSVKIPEWLCGKVASLRLGSGLIRYVSFLLSALFKGPQTTLHTASHTKLRTEIQPLRHWYCCRPIRPITAIPHAVSWQAASSKQGPEASKEARRSCKGHHDRHLDQVLAPAVCSPEHSYSIQLCRFPPCCRSAPMVGEQPRWMPSAGRLLPRVLGNGAIAREESVLP